MTTEIFELQFAGDGMTWDKDIFCNRLALDDLGQLVFASIICDAMQYKGIRGALCTNKKVQIKAPGMKVGKPGVASREPNFMLKHPVGYKDVVHKLPYRKVHAFVAAKLDGLLMAASEPHVWRELSSDRFTTPILREWMPTIVNRLLGRDLLVPCYGFNCNIAILKATTKDLDSVVSDSLRDGMIAIPEKSA